MFASGLPFLQRVLVLRKNVSVIISLRPIQIFIHVEEEENLSKSLSLS